MFRTRSGKFYQSRLTIASDMEHLYPENGFQNDVSQMTLLANQIAAFEKPPIRGLAQSINLRTCLSNIYRSWNPFILSQFYWIIDNEWECRIFEPGCKKLETISHTRQ